MLPFSDRAEAGGSLASELVVYEGLPDVIVVALPRGGVLVAYEIAQRLRAPLDVLVVRKIGVPWQPELAMGAVASGGIRILDHALMESLRLSNYFVYEIIKREEEEIKKREVLFRDGLPAQSLSGRTVILVDDGAATGSTMLAAIEAVRRQEPKDIVVALPVASQEAHRALEAESAQCVCLATPEPFSSVGQWYASFPQVSNEEVKALLSKPRAKQAGKAAAFHASVAS